MNIISLPNRDVLVICLPKRAVIAEIGVFRGDFSQRISKLSLPKELHLIDPWEYIEGREYPDSVHQEKNVQKNWDCAYNTVLRLFMSEIKHKQVHVHKGYSFDVLNEFPNAYFDWIYLDANHSYSSVKRDLELCARKVKPAGLICCDDYIERNPSDSFEYGTVEAVNEFCNTQGWRIVCWADNLWKGANYRNCVIAHEKFATAVQIRLAIKYFLSLRAHTFARRLISRILNKKYK